jgi:hypothetical protein
MTASSNLESVSSIFAPDKKLSFINQPFSLSIIQDGTSIPVFAWQAVRVRKNENWILQNFYPLMVTISCNFLLPLMRTCI